MFTFSNENKPFFFLTLGFILIVGITLGYFVNHLKPVEESIYCTQDAKLCPDGSYVGRIAPDCEFAECPICEGDICRNPNDIIPDGWETQIIIEQGIEFSYPEEFPAKYISGNEWPPNINLEIGDFKCEAGPQESSLPNVTLNKIVNGRVYCVESKTEAAAGSVYTTYIYKTQSDTKLISAEFTLQYPQCLNFDDLLKTECQEERENFNLDALIDRIINSIKII